MSQRILVTGGSGFVGSVLAQRLPHALYPTRSELDLTDGPAVLRFFEATQPDVVIHMAARVGGITANIQQPADFILDNVRIDANVCAAVRKVSPGHFVPLLSTCMYPDRLAEAQYPMSEALVEAGPPPPTNAAYASAKRTLWHAAQALHSQYKIPYTCVAPANIYGPGDHFGSAQSHFLAAAISRLYRARATREAAVEFFGTGQALRQYVYVHDVAYVIEQFVLRGPANALVNVAPVASATIAQLARAVAEIVGYRGRVQFSGVGPDGQIRKDVSLARLQALLPEWLTHETPLHVGLKETLDWYERQQRGSA